MECVVLCVCVSVWEREIEANESEKYRQTVIVFQHTAPGVTATHISTRPLISVKATMACLRGKRDPNDAKNKKKIKKSEAPLLFSVNLSAHTNCTYFYPPESKWSTKSQTHDWEPEAQNYRQTLQILREEKHWAFFQRFAQRGRSLSTSLLTLSRLSDVKRNDTFFWRNEGLD